MDGWMCHLLLRYLMCLPLLLLLLLLACCYAYVKSVLSRRCFGDQKTDAEWWSATDAPAFIYPTQMIRHTHSRYARRRFLIRLKIVWRVTEMLLKCESETETETVRWLKSLTSWPSPHTHSLLSLSLCLALYQSCCPWLSGAVICISCLGSEWRMRGQSEGFAMPIGRTRATADTPTHLHRAPHTHTH